MYNISMPFKNVTRSGEIMDYRYELKPGSLSLVNDVLIQISHERRYSNNLSWTVLQHSYAIFKCAKDMGYDYDFCRHALTHDFHEAIVRDVPTPIKEAIGEAWYRVEDTVALRLANYFEYPILSDLSPEEQEEFKKLDKDFAKYEWTMFIENKTEYVPDVIRSSIVSVLGIDRKDLIIRVAETFLNLA